ncbi:hypothetical protein [Natronolimnobius baerhuensis]|uniref:hypothetical protein n=1 Tax=Natronolimnobius baerhuensis TaxID=253108 RepID=UPI0011250DEF|nr:hypothetical protein [Natronolimnobius baerhuensis]
MKRRGFLAASGTATVATLSGCLGYDTDDVREAASGMSERVTRESISPSEPGDELDAAGVRYILGQLGMDVTGMEGRRLANVSSARLRLTYRSAHPTDSPVGVGDVTIPLGDTDYGPDPAEAVVETAYNEFSDEFGSPEAEMAVVTTVFAAYAEGGGDHDGIDVTVIDGFDETIYTYSVESEWTTRWTDGPAQYEEIHERVMDTVEG